MSNFRLEDVLGQVGRDGGPSVPRDIMSSWKRGEISFQDYKTHSAAWVCDNAQQYRPKAYPEMSESLAAYVRARAGGNRDHDGSFGQRLGAWVELVVDIKEQNEADERLLLWSAETCARANLHGKANAGLTAVEERQGPSFPYLDFSHAIRVQSLDARDRQANLRIAR